MLTRIFMNSDLTRCKSSDINKCVFTYSDNLHRANKSGYLGRRIRKGRRSIREGSA